MVGEEATADCPHTDGGKEEPGWRFWSTRDSIEHDAPSVSAVIETLLAVPAFWWLAGTVGFYLPLMISMAVAPFVLLRSDESVNLGLRWFLRWHEHKGSFSFSNPKALDHPKREEREDMSALNFAARLIILLGSGGVSIMAILLSLDRSLPLLRAPAWLGIVLVVWFAGFTFYLAVNVLTGFASLFISRLSETWVTLPRGQLTILTNIVVSSCVTGLALAAALSSTGATGETVATILGLLAGASKVITSFPFFTASERQSRNILFLPLLLVLGLPVAPATAMFVFAETALIRIAATARHLPKGLEALPRNFRRLVICTSPAQLPELIPGLIPGQQSSLRLTLGRVGGLVGIEGGVIS